MKKRYLSLLLLSVGALSLSSCGASEISAEEFKTQLTNNSKKEAPGYTKGKIKTEIKNYKFECSNVDLGKTFEGILSASLKASLIAQGFNIDKNADLSKGFKETRDLTETEFKVATEIRYSASSLDTDGENAKFYKDGSSLKVSQKVEEANAKSEATIYFDEFSYLTGMESSVNMEMKEGEESFKLSLHISTFYTFSK